MTAVNTSKNLASAAMPAGTTRRILYTIPDTCEQLSLSRTTILRMIERGELQTIRLGQRAIRIPAASIDKLLGQAFEAAQA